MTERQYGILGTFIIHNIIVLILLFTYITLSRPLSSEGGILINFGDMERAGGPEEPALNDQMASQTTVSQASSTEKEEGMLTQDFEEAPVVNKPAETAKPEKKSVTKPVQKSTPEPKKPTLNPKASYKGAKGVSTTETGSSEGIYRGSGNMGDPTGTPESDNYAKGLGGNGVEFSLRGRNPLYLQKPEFNILKEGIVVVEITVDRSGKVISATPGKQGSTIADKTLYEASRKAALESKFNLKSDAPDLQVGKITYHFKLQ